jgi:hypothetical protein
MEATNARGPVALAWTDVAACTLPTTERPLRLAEFDQVFATALLSVERSGETRARLLLSGDDTLRARTQRLVDAESSCCSFFTFDVATPSTGLVRIDIAVPATHADVLVGLLARAQAAQGAMP